ncbi:MULTISPECIES: hypothetical protein [unclassified Mesorhizobium]|uniref:hypothetical protein n=1 Tax=unclassified Mesorhizobium TaxID=325217 RepID=UPI001093803B|nr:MULTISPECIES: hypothetical protein [unclassified Mesorhizobium]TGT90881.1 hypothetical protein EN804_05970 [Mesorhizobium sp. M8A.F.Ca.ET.161.01.1.1]TGV43839.1 hypothetical protein EN785_07575 [Mesorhizobium sp. M8A.F.Ca.ET.142.01.1.1]TGV93985.1 hypothetical protein EN788_60345 [Mesorhizobium sp. M2D.F.Ca.ET.145.01.1.1]
MSPQAVKHIAAHYLDYTRQRAAEITRARDPYEQAVAAMDRAFGLGAEEAHAILRTDAEAKRIYDCALQALMEQQQS